MEVACFLPIRTEFRSKMQTWGGVKKSYNWAEVLWVLPWPLPLRRWTRPYCRSILRPMHEMHLLRDIPTGAEPKPIAIIYPSSSKKPCTMQQTHRAWWEDRDLVKMELDSHSLGQKYVDSRANLWWLQRVAAKNQDMWERHKYISQGQGPSLDSV